MSLGPDDAMRFEECLAGDGVAVIPTDTVYGLACNPESDIAIRRVYELKRRPTVKPAAVMFFSLAAALESLTELGPRTRLALGELLPGPVTLLLANPGRRFPLACDPVGINSGLLGLRVPVLSGPLTALAAVSKPAAQSSANFSGNSDPRCLADVSVELREGADLVLDGGELPGTASTVIDLSHYEQSGDWRIMREGPLGRPLLERLLGPLSGGR
ncbi:MAG: Sua5/YciO/YrdC/YwlC family protein [Solirubrobacteraceae bacterium]